MKTSYEAELDYLLSNSKRAKKEQKRIQEIREILAESDAIEIYTKRNSPNSSRS
jgi:hypothetical protein